MAALGRALQHSRQLVGGLRDAAAACRRTFSSDNTIEVEVKPYERHRCEAPDNKVTTTKEELLRFFEVMYRMRRMEIAADMLYKAKLVRGFCHLYDGQEAVVTGMDAGVTKEDSFITSYRDHALHLIRGGTVKEVIGELLGRKVGASTGLGGSMHMYNLEHSYYGGSGIVGAQVPIGAGIALAHKLKGEKKCCFSMYGDGAANQGQVFEAMNISALWSVPVVFVCENNHYGMGTSTERGAKSDTYYTRGDYIPGIRVDGMDVLAVKKATEWAKAYVIENGPLVFEADTYRYHGHSMSDPGSTYRTRDEVSTMRQARDPVERVRKLLIDNNFAEAGELKATEKAVKREIDAAIEECKAAGPPGLEYLNANIYKDPVGAQMRGATADTWIPAHVIPYERPAQGACCSRGMRNCSMLVGLDACQAPSMSQEYRGSSLLLRLGVTFLQVQECLWCKKKKKKKKIGRAHV
eukprot:TRINITY_DN1816_c2_g2_i6.p1 TRINITY_DN1816_c2_g2~~TRINITY_DN1816_c2_g2_i6.p1  ORF type:complete len:465 (-),score=79.25 TRINITY_DN1816_c2_g2_i6:57-1451(-)